jgi:hypothetical protein
MPIRIEFSLSKLELADINIFIENHSQ